MKAARLQTQSPEEANLRREMVSQEPKLACQHECTYRLRKPRSPWAKKDYWRGSKIWMSLHAQRSCRAKVR